MAARGFVVTFHQIDPLFTFDPDPRQPRAVGQLTVPGFSIYLHPPGDHHLMAVGIHQPDPEQPGPDNLSIGAPKPSLFDVTDFAHPRELTSILLTPTGGWSGATVDHRAFTFAAEKNLLALPVNSWDNNLGTQIHELRVFSVDPLARAGGLRRG